MTDLDQLQLDLKLLQDRLDVLGELVAAAHVQAAIDTLAASNHATSETGEKVVRLSRSS